MKKKIIIKIEGMSCMHCAKTVMEALENLENVLKVKVNLKRQEALVIYKDDIDTNLIKETINDLGYNFVEAISC